MKQSSIILCFLITGLAIPTQARTFKGLSAGTNASYSNYNKFGAEGFAQANLQFGRFPFEPKLGLSYCSFTTDYKDFNNLNVESIGFFVEGDIYPFSNYFYTGLRLDIDVNWFNNQAMNALNNINEPVVRTFPGSRLYAVIGLDIPINQQVSLRISAMPGWQFYTISDNWKITSGSSGINLNSYNGITYNRFAFQINAGFAIRLWNK